MMSESVCATATIPARAGAVFAVLTDPTSHAGIDGTGWVSGAVDTEPLTRAGQVFRMSMFHPGHPDGGYETHNEVLCYAPAQSISWRTGYLDESGELAFGGWWWRYDLTPGEPRHTEVTLTYDWSAVGPGPREYLSFPPFPQQHLDDSLRHLSELVADSGETAHTDR